MTAKDYISALGERVVQVTGDPRVDIGKPAADSRDIMPGDLFIAIPGNSVDGARYIPEAIGRGAVAIMAQEPCPDILDSLCFIQVDDAYAAAAQTAETYFGRPADVLRCLGITGTNGKTTSAFLLQTILKHSGSVCGMLGTVHYDTGKRLIPQADRTTPPAFQLQALLREIRDNGCTDLVAEVSSHALAQHRFGTTQFAGAIFTNLTGDHLDYHGTESAYLEAKARLFTELLCPQGIAVVNTDSEGGRQLRTTIAAERPDVSVRAFGFERDADYRLLDFEAGVSGLSFHLRGPDISLALKSPLPGRFNAENIAGAVLLAACLGVEPTAIASAVREFAGAPGRMQTVDLGDNRRAVIDYAHTDDALKNVLETLKNLHPKRLTVVFGCGGDRDRSKRPRMGRVAADLADKIIVTSDNPRTELPPLIINDICCGIHEGVLHERMVDRRAAIRRALEEAIPGEIVLIAGKGHEDYQEIHGEKTHFNDLEEVEAFLKLH